MEYATYRYSQFCTPIGAHSARPSLIGALIGELCGIDVLRMYVYIDADYTGSTIYVWMHACMYVLCMYVCLYSIRRAIRRADR